MVLPDGHEIELGWDSACMTWEEVDEEATRVRLKKRVASATRQERGWRWADDPPAWWGVGAHSIDEPKEGAEVAQSLEVSMPSRDVPEPLSLEEEAMARSDIERVVNALGFETHRPLGWVAYTFVSGG